MPKPEQLIIKNTQAPGDYIVLSAAIRDIVRAYPGRYDVHVNVRQPDVYRGNPMVKIAGSGVRSNAQVIVAKYNDKRARFGIHKSNQERAHFMWGFLAGLNFALKLNAPLTEFRPDLHLTPEEKAKPLLNLDKPYWVFVSGGKKDFTAKWWHIPWWQDVVNMLKEHVVMVQVGGGSHIHPLIAGAHDLVKKTSFRDMMRLIYHSQGVICIVTCLMHIAAAFNKPCIVIGGGREPWWWEAYNEENRLYNMRLGIPDWKPPVGDTFIPHRYIHTMNQLPCCMNMGCWKSRVGKDGKRCHNQVMRGGVYLPKCLDMITPEMVVNEWKWYFDNGICSLKSAPRLVIKGSASEVVAATSVPVFKPTISDVEFIDTGNDKAVVCAYARPAPIKKRAVANTTLHVYMNGLETDVGKRMSYVMDNVKGTGVCVRSIYNGVHPVGVPELYVTGAVSSRAELLRQMINTCKTKNFVWIEGRERFVDDNWLSNLVGNGEPSGIVKWTKVNAYQLGLIRNAAWFKGIEPEPFKLDNTCAKVYHFDQGAFSIQTEVLKQISWPDLHLPDAQLDIMLGEALRQYGVKLRNVGVIFE